MNTRNKNHSDVYEQVTDLVIAELEKGTVVWQQGWNGHQGLPKNLIAGNTYRGWNVFWLSYITSVNGYSAPHFLTYRQAVHAGGHIRKGEKGHLVTYWMRLERRDTKNPAEPAIDNQQTPGRSFLFPRYYIVFNVDQAEGIKCPPQSEFIPLNENQRMSACEKVVAEMPHPPVIHHSGNGAFYVPSKDELYMPPFTLFHSGAEYYTTLFHELAHSTGHGSRLNRKELVSSDGFGGTLYSREELTAELASAFICGVCGITQTIPNTAAYLNGWIKALKGDKTLIIKAASQAQAAADYILNNSPDKDMSDEAQESRTSIAAASVHA